MIYDFLIFVVGVIAGAIGAVALMIALAGVGRDDDETTPPED